MSFLPGGSLARSLWAAPSLKESRRRIYTPSVVGADTVMAWMVLRDLQPWAAGFDASAVPLDALAAHGAAALAVHTLLYLLLSVGRGRSFKLSREREQVEAGEITIDEAAARFSKWPQRRLVDSGRGRDLTVSASGSPVIGAAFVTGPVFGFKAPGAFSYRWVDPAENMRAEGQMRAVINPRSRNEWVLPFPDLGEHAIPEGYIGRSAGMLAAAEAMRKFQEERRANGPRLAPGATSFQDRPAPNFTYTPYTGKVPEQILDVLSDLVSLRSEVSAMHIVWSSAPGSAPKLTALVEAHHDRTTVARDVISALQSVPGGDRLEVRLMDPRETGAVRELRSVAVG